VTSRVSQVTIDARDVSLVSTFWSAALGYRVEQGNDGSAKLYPPESAGPDVVTIWVQAVTEGKHGKNPVHLDLNAAAGDDAADAEVERLLALGATRVDVGQRETDPFVVLADPEGNEFCVLRRSPRAGDSP
jgi:hypothetical protein